MPCIESNSNIFVCCYTASFNGFHFISLGIFTSTDGFLFRISLREQMRVLIIIIIIIINYRAYRLDLNMCKDLLQTMSDDNLLQVEGATIKWKTVHVSFIVHDASKSSTTACVQQ
jgi:hypothetical protein